MDRSLRLTATVHVFDSRVDARIEAKLTTHLSAMVIGQNLSSRAHAEFADVFVAPTLIPRSVRVQLTFRH